MHILVYLLVLKDIEQDWQNQTNGAPLKYVGGNIDFIFQYRIYDDTPRKVILETFGHKNPWADHEDIIKSGALILAKEPEELVERAKETVIYLPENYEVKPIEYNYEITNKANSKTKKFKLYYAIIPPQKG